MSAKEPLTGLLRMAGPDDWPEPTWFIPDAVIRAKILCCSLFLKTSATVANRVPTLQVTDRQGLIVCQFGGTIPITASSSLQVNFVDVAPEIFEASVHLIVPFQQMIVQGGDQVSIVNLNSDDVVDNSLLTVLVDPLV